MKSLIAAAVVFGLAFLFWLFCLNHISANSVGIAYNSIDGSIKLQPTPGWYVTSPFTRVSDMSTLPMRVTIPSQARIINQRLVRFRPEGYKQFIDIQGFTIANGASLENILMGYAFSGKSYEFLEILEEPDAR